MSFDSLSLECFIAVSQTRSFTKAAERANRTQSAVSQQIAKLEEMLGKPLFFRGKNFSLTPEGEIFYSYATQILSLQRQALERIQEPDLEGTVRFGLPEDFASIFLTDVLIDFVNIHPRVLLNIECDLTLNLLARFKNKEFDLVLVKISKPEDVEHSQDVWSEKLEWVGNKNHFASFDVKKPLPLVLSPTPCLYRQRAIEGLEKAQIPWQLVFSSSSYTSKIAAVKAGLGITVLPKSLIPPGLSILEAKRLPPLSDTHNTLLKHETNNLAVASFEEFIMKKLHH